MTAAATTSRTPRTPRAPWSSHSQAKPSTTPLGNPARTPSAISHNNAVLTPQGRSPSAKQAQTSSPSYFGLQVDGDGENPTNSDAGGHAKKNWQTSPSAARSNVHTSPRSVPHDSNPSLSAFRRQSESKVFQLDSGSFSVTASPNLPPNAKRNPRDGRLSTQLSPRSQGNEEKAKVDGHVDGAMDIDGEEPARNSTNTSSAADSSAFGFPRRESPADLPTLGNSAQRQLSSVDDRHPRLSLPHHRIHESNKEAVKNNARASTLPSSLNSEGPSMIMPQNLYEIMQSTSPDKILILDVRVSPQYVQSRVRGSLNLCIPTTLLKRPSFNTQKLQDTFTLDEEKEKFAQWKAIRIIVLYDASSHQLKDAGSAVNTVKKFTNEGWSGRAFIVRGGFQEISKKFPALVEKPGSEDSSSSSSHLSIDSKAAGCLQVAGGLAMPATRTAANPFFGNIRQNMDLIGGVGQLPVKRPDALGLRSFKVLPTWLQKAAEEEDRGKAVSDKFLKLEKAEQQRMKSALSTDVTYGNSKAPSSSASSVQIAGIEKGTKNRYKDILPYNHTRVKLQNVPTSECDYINASHVKAEWSNRHYIATQAPMPSTFEDFWRVVWEQDARVIVMLSAESEGGQRKCHPYWLPDSYGPMKLKALSERKTTLGASPPTPSAAASSSSSNNLSPDNTYKKPLLTPQPERFGASRRRATNPFGAAAQEAARDQSASFETEAPFVVVRHLTLSHAAQPFAPIREITQLQYSNWPDFGAPAHPSDLLGLVEHCNAVIRGSNGGGGGSASASSASFPASSDAAQPVGPGERPVVVHCSAGCGRTGTFCTVDSVIDMLKRQRCAAAAARTKTKTKTKTASAKQQEGSEKTEETEEEEEEEEMDEDDEDAMDIDRQPANGAKDVDGDESWIRSDEHDLVAKTVEDFRLQRLSMVQTLRQYVLCYETVLEWLVREMPERFTRREAVRRSYGG